MIIVFNVIRSSQPLDECDPDVVRQVVHRTGKGSAKALFQIIRVAPHIQGAKRQHLVKSRAVGKVLHPEACGSDILTIPGLHFDRLAHHFGIELFTGQRRRRLFFLAISRGNQDKYKDSYEKGDKCEGKLEPIGGELIWKQQLVHRFSIRYGRNLRH